LYGKIGEKLFKINILEKVMEMISGAFGAINWEVVAQLSMVGLIMVAGPVVIFVLATLRGNM
jgi:hypothetical protein